jgi:hypothetical protein
VHRRLETLGTVVTRHEDLSTGPGSRHIVTRTAVLATVNIYFEAVTIARRGCYGLHMIAAWKAACAVCEDKESQLLVTCDEGIPRSQNAATQKKVTGICQPSMLFHSTCRVDALRCRWLSLHSHVDIHHNRVKEATKCWACKDLQH